MRPTTAREFEIRVGTQQHIPLLLLLLLLVVSLLFPPPRHAKVGLSGRCSLLVVRGSFHSGPPVWIYASLADGRHVAVVARGAHLTVLQLLI